MASVIERPDGRRWIQFVGADRKRRTIRLGKVPARLANSIRARVEHLVVASVGNCAVDADTARWLAGLESGLYDKLAAVRLVPERDSETATLAAFLNAYIESRVDVKPGTKLVYGHTRRCLVEYFGEGKPLRGITPGDADEWRLFLIGQGLAENTVRRRCGIAKQYFRAAVRRGLIERNPFEDLPSLVRGNPTKEYFLSVENAERIIEACPDVEWRLLVALARYGGLRTPSESLGLRWADVDWGGERITIRSSKTEHHEGGGIRQVPIFHELRPHLMAAFEQAEPGAEFCITRYRDTAVNLRTQLTRIIQRAGLETWPKLWQNMRATRETELAERWPVHVVCKWIGNSQLVAAKHYLQVTDEHFAKLHRVEKKRSIIRSSTCTKRPAKSRNRKTNQKAKMT